MGVLRVGCQLTNAFVNLKYSGKMVANVEEIKMLEDLVDSLCNPAGTCLACQKTAPIVRRYFPLHGFEPLCFSCSQKFDVAMKDRYECGEEGKPGWVLDIIRQMPDLKEDLPPIMFDRMPKLEDIPYRGP